MSLRPSSAALAALLLFAPATARAASRSGAAPPALQSFDYARRIDANLVNMVTTNAGAFAYDIVNGFPGLVYPRGSGLTAVFASGLWVGGRVAGDPRVTVAEYSLEYAPGRIIGGIADDPELPRYHVYKVRPWTGDPSDTAHVDRTPAELAADPDLDPIAHHSWSEYLNGATPDGAPVRLWRLPLTATPDPSDSMDVPGPDAIGSQFLWAVYNDADPSRHTNDAGGTPPLGLEVRQTTFSFDVPGPLGDVVFLRFHIRNRGAQTVNGAYVGLWSDPDVGGFTDDLVGCDVQRAMGFAYNATNNDQLYGSSPPAVGFRLLRGAAGASGPGGFAAFVRYVNGTDPISPAQSYNYLQGLLPDGSAQIDPTTAMPTTYGYSGDPVAGTGWLDSGPSDRRFLVSTGPFTFAPGDSQEVVLAVIVARAQDRLASITKLACESDLAKEVFDSGFAAPLPTTCSAPTPTAASLVEARAEAGRVRIVWHIGTPAAEAVIQRRSEPGPWVDLERAVADAGGLVELEDRAVEAGATYGYRLVLDGGATVAGETTVVVPFGPALELAGLAPNPGPDLAVSLSLASRRAARLELLDVAGRRLAAADVGALGPGRHVVTLSPGRRLAPGAYVLRLAQDGHVVVRKAALLR